MTEIPSVLKICAKSNKSSKNCLLPVENKKWDKNLVIRSL